MGDRPLQGFLAAGQSCEATHRVTSFKLPADSPFWAALNAGTGVVSMMFIGRESVSSFKLVV
ncbi:hypothetical protein K8R78_08220, partial [bacterium]|nr:hypothetical protein [bacterium]